MKDLDNDDELMAARCGVLVDSALGQYQLRWLIVHAGEHGVTEAVSRLAGRRRPYTINIAGVLGLAMPKSLPNPELTLPPTKSPADTRGEMVAEAERHSACNEARAERNQRALEAEATAAKVAQALKIAALKAKLRSIGKLPPPSPESPVED